MKELFEEIVKGNAILITGSGANSGVETIDGEKFPMGTGLAKCLYEQCEIENPDNWFDLQDASETYIEKYSDTKLISFIKRRLQVGKVGDVAPILYKMPWLRCYTTNYDNVPIIASPSEDVMIPVTLSDSVKKYREENRLCVYINGHIDKLSEDTLNSEFKLTGKSYLAQSTLYESQWSKVFEDDLDMASVVIIIGLSLEYDLELKRFIYNNSIKEKIVFIEREDISENKKRKLERLGSVKNVGVEVFATKLGAYYEDNYSVQEAGVPMLYTLFEKNGYVSNYEKPYSTDIYDFLMNGKFTNKLLYKERGKYTGLVFRKEVNTIIREIENDKKVIFLHANLGNGKSTILHMVVQQLCNRSINSFWYNNENAGKLSKEIMGIANEKGKKVIIIENYFNNMNIIEKINSSGAKNVCFILTARTVLFDSRLRDVIDLLNISQGESIVVDVNHLKNNEIMQCIDLFDRNEFWGKNTKLSKGQKKTILKKETGGNSQIQTILIGVIESTDMSERLVEIVCKIKNNSSSYFATLILMLISRVMSLDISIKDINMIMGNSVVFDPNYQKNEAVQELIDFSENNLRHKVKSSIVALMIIKELKCEYEIINVLKKTALYANRYSQTQKYENLLKNIVSYSHVSSFVRRKNQSREFMINYYDSLKEVDYYKENAFFWLQYSIACLREHDFKLAQNYVDVAYEKFRENEHNVPFQIDNQQARIKLELIKNNKSLDLLSDLEKAHSLIMQPIVSVKDREENMIRLLYYYKDSAFIRNVRQCAEINVMQKYCGEAYNKVNEYLKRLPVENDRKRYSDLANKLLKISVEDI